MDLLMNCCCNYAFPILFSIELKYADNTGFNKIKIIFSGLTPIETVKDRVL
jgi:hypothetical protein